MPALYIKEQLVDAVERSKVKQLIRRVRGRPIKLDDRLYLYTDNRVVNRRRLRSTKCDDVLPIFIDSNRSVILGSKVLTEKEKHELALENGYQSFMELCGHFKNTGGLPVSGQLIKWL